ncbi:hypothetical protein D3C87_640530 [compost metagenome]
MFKRTSVLALTLAMTALAGCGDLPGSMTPGTGTGSNVSLLGRVTHLGQAPGQELSLGLKRFDGANFQKIGVTTRSTRQGDYQFQSLDSGKYQVFYDDQGEVVDSADVNTVGAYVDAAVQVVEIGMGAAPNVSFDVGWDLSPTIKPNATFRANASDRFSFSSKYGDTGVEYQILVADSGKSSVWSSAWTQSTSFSWNGNRGSETNAPTSAYTGTGSHYYQVKFRTPGTKFGGEGSYGQTKWIPFSLSR